MVGASEDFVRVYVDCTSASSLRKDFLSDLMKKYGVTGFPTVLFLGPDGVVLKKMCGNCDAAEFLDEMSAIAGPWRPERRLPRALEGLGDLRDWVEGRVERLGDDDIGAREQATSELASLREALDAALRLALETPDPERRERIRSLLRHSGATIPPDPSAVPKAGGADASGPDGGKGE